MRALLRFFLMLCALLCTIQVQAEGLVLKGLSLDLNLPQGKTQTSFGLSYRPVSRKEAEQRAAAPNPCIGGIETVYYVHAQHRQTPSRQFLNEDIDGLAEHCYLSNGDSPLKPFVLVGGMTNSQFQPTIFFGPGFRLELPGAWGLTPYIGGKAPWVIYVMRNQKAAQGILPTAFVGLSYALSKDLTLEAFKEWLPKGEVKIYGNSSGIRPAGSILDAPAYNNQIPPYAGYMMEGRMRPSLRLQLSFRFFDLL